MSMIHPDPEYSTNFCWSKEYSTNFWQLQISAFEFQKKTWIYVAEIKELTRGLNIKLELWVPSWMGLMKVIISGVQCSLILGCPKLPCRLPSLPCGAELRYTLTWNIMQINLGKKFVMELGKRTSHRFKARALKGCYVGAHCLFALLFYTDCD